MSGPKPASSDPAGPIAEVIVDVPVPGVDRVFHYLVPETLAARVRVGQRVLVPFGGRRVEGYVVGFAAETGVSRLKPLLAIRSEDPFFDTDGLALAQWLCERYLCLRVEALRCLAPPGATGPDAVRARLVPGWRLTADEAIARAAMDELLARAPKQAAVLALLLQAAALGDTRPLPAAEIRRRTGAPDSSLKALAQRGLVQPAAVRIEREPAAPQVQEPAAPLALTAEQEAALAAINAARREGDLRPVLLQGVTGSGKTEIYLRLVAETLAAGRGALVLVPEIALTPQTFARFSARFPGRVAVLHSGLGAGERFDQWERVAQGRAPVVIGARSAVFAPVRDLGLVIVDEEHETSYKQEESPRYHAREVALERARRAGALCVLGSATPSLESYVQAQAGRFRLIRLTRRVDGRELPPVDVVDMRAEMVAGNRSIFSRRLTEALRECLARGRQAVLFLNRRGFSQFMLCRECGHVVRCPDCAVSYTYHAAPTEHLRCHYCDALQPVPAHCPQCGGPYLRPFGAGTQRVETLVRELFPHARVRRMDLDTTARKGSHTALFEAVRRGEVDVIVGTQMVAKGLDFPNVTLVGVVAADSALHVPDFRAAERTFQLLVQVGGRAGRGADPGRVIVQTYQPDHYSIAAARVYDDDGFYRREAAYRQGGGYPPFTALVRILISGPEGVAEAAKAVARAVRQCAAGADVTVTGPAPAPLQRLRGRERWHVIIKGQGDGPRQVAMAAREMWRPLLGRGGVSVAIDVDPVSLL
ncbi:MAG TPA: primosomal protein N' [Limnochordales bacterium]